MTLKRVMTKSIEQSTSLTWLTKTQGFQKLAARYGFFQKHEKSKLIAEEAAKLAKLLPKEKHLAEAATKITLARIQADARVAIQRTRVRSEALVALGFFATVGYASYNFLQYKKNNSGTQELVQEEIPSVSRKSRRNPFAKVSQAVGETIEPAFFIAADTSARIFFPSHMREFDRRIAEAKRRSQEIDAQFEATMREADKEIARARELRRR